ncbi:5-oxoprolinase subunit C family protein [Aeribacillus alveayuensis]|uniref:Antagonist of KipI n=1 Tax=Aeribacillus alveayuensis TaxID=279215 RepID=A0ABT9VPV1_9BACI|nr:antagonist of KipI [Bacillus alveayuensis]
MNQPLFEVIKPGLLTTIQDLGRYGYQQYGIVAAGAMDSYAMRMANVLVGNDLNEGVLEATMLGPSLLCLHDAVIAICGGDLSPMVNGSPAPLWKSFLIKKGETLTFHAPKNGARAYISVSGGFDAPRVLGSKSTYLKAQLGGYNGRELQKGDILSGSGEMSKKNIGRSLHPQLIPIYEKNITVRVVLGPHEHMFTEKGIETFLTTTYTVTPQSDRMGYRLSGAKIEHVRTADIISDAVPLGGIQVPSSGEPIILMADRQTTGGYTRIGTIISVDLPKVAQLLPKSTIRFQKVSVAEAQQYALQEAKLFKIFTLANI